MKWKTVGESVCPVARTAAVLGDRWTLLILREAFLGTRHFDGFERVLGISPHLLSTRLKRLVAAGVLQRHADRSYRLTPAGLELQPIILTMVRWGGRWRSDGIEPGSALVHRDCGHVFDPEIVCSACGETVDTKTVTVAFSPALAAERQAS